MELSDIIATIGVTILLVAFFFLSINKLKSTDASYLLLNFIGAVLTGYSSWMINFIPLVILEAVWAVVSLYGLFTLPKK